MSAKQKILVSMGTRPEIIKMLPVYFELKKQGFDAVLMHTGQHSDMAYSLYDLFDVVPDCNIELDRSEIGHEDCQLSSLSALLLQKISRAMKDINPDAVLVHGDTSSAVMAALAAFYQQRAVGHVEAGLRSYNEYNPFPEEKNRVLIGQLAHWHFAPTERARQNLLDEGIAEEAIYMIGNTIVEAAEMGAERLETYRSRQPKTGEPDLIDQLSACKEKKMILVTVHRRENQEEHINYIVQAIVELMEKHEDYIVVWPVHSNPVVKNAVHQGLAGLSTGARARLFLTNPLDYPVLLWILKHSWLVLTDSGGIQEEAVALSTPVFVLRETTERPEVIEAGGGMLIGTDKVNIVLQVETLYEDAGRYAAMCNAKNPFGDGKTASNIGKILIKGKPERDYA